LEALLEMTKRLRCGGNLASIFLPPLRLLLTDALLGATDFLFDINYETAIKRFGSEKYRTTLPGESAA
jgi:hypothetical protein